ncbi:MAG: Glutamate racemase, partial [Microgenomates group bacterium GW2011_GWF1_38_5]
MDNRPIGIFDSGLGGLTVVKEIKKILPNEQIIYLGDTARVPYGTRGKETVIRFALEDALFLTKFKIKCLVIACNTASAFAYQEVAKMVGIPVIDMIIPGSIGALRDGKTKKIAVI